MTLELSGVIPVKPLSGSPGLVIFDSKKGNIMDEEETEPQQLYTVRTRFHQHGDYEKDLTFGDAMHYIQKRFENSNGAVHFASIELQA